MRYAILVFGLTILSMLVIEFNGRTAELNRLSEESIEVQADLEERLGTKSALQTQVAYATSEVAVIQWAHEDGHMVREGEIPVVPISTGAVIPTPTPRATAKPELFDNRQSWLKLFSGPLPP